MKISIARIIDPNHKNIVSIGEKCLVIQLLIGRGIIADGWNSCDRTHAYGRPATLAELEEAFSRSILSAVCASKMNLAKIWKIRSSTPDVWQDQQAWKLIEGLQGYRLPTRSLNKYHRGINVLIKPELTITQFEIGLTCSVSSLSEVRSVSRGGSASWWPVSFLMRSTRMPTWRTQREPFHRFALKAAEFFKSIRKD